MPVLEKIPYSSFQADALAQYYELYKRNNLERNRRIKEIDREYEESLAQWENDYASRLSMAETEYWAKKKKKQSYRWLSLKSLGTAFVVILILSLFILIISMVRNVNRLTEALYESNKMNKELLERDKN